MQMDSKGIDMQPRRADLAIVAMRRSTKSDQPFNPPWRPGWRRAFFDEEVAAARIGNITCYVCPVSRKVVADAQTQS
jgi:hypothetical protein